MCYLQVIQREIMGQVYRMGKLEEIPTPKIKHKTKQKILKDFDLPQLLYDYKRFLFLINKHYLKYGIAKDLGNLVSDYCEILLKFIDDYPWEKPSINKKMKSMVEKLSSDSQIAKNNYLQYKDSNDVPKTVHVILTFSFDAVIHFLWQYNLVINSFTPGEKMPNKPTDWDRKRLCFEIIERHQNINGQTSFPSHKETERIMKSNGYILPRRTYGDWKTQWKEETFEHFVQNRKNGQ